MGESGGIVLRVDLHGSGLLTVDGFLLSGESFFKADGGDAIRERRAESSLLLIPMEVSDGQEAPL